METLQPTLTIDHELLKNGRDVFRAINHSLRLQMIQLIHQHSKITVTEIYVKMRLEQSVASQHLAILRKEGYVKTERSGKHIFYSVNYTRINQVQDLSQKITGR